MAERLLKSIISVCKRPYNEDDVILTKTNKKKFKKVCSFTVRAQQVMQASQIQVVLKAALVYLVSCTFKSEIGQGGCKDRTGDQ